MKFYFIPVALAIIFISGCKKETFTASSVNSIETDKSTAVVFKVAGVLSSNMVVQRNKPFKVWGTAVAGHTITVKASWDSDTFTSAADAAGNWTVSIPSAAANSNAQTLDIKEDGILKSSFNNILIGEVWVCSGQSNMDMPVDSTGAWPFYEGVINYQQEIADANYPMLRLVKINQDFKNKPVNDLSFKTSWTVCSPVSVKQYSAAAYFFGRKLMLDLNVPVGLVVSSVGGTACEAWTQKETIQANAVLDAYYSGRNFSSQLFNGMIYPLRNLSVKGFIWYQGESNRHDTPAVNYTKLNTAMIGNWRNTFNQGNLSFYLVQMTPYNEKLFLSGTSSDYDYSLFREAQTNIRAAVNTGMAVTMDAGAVLRIHPKNKKPVGERLALLALNKDYGETVQCVGPQYFSFTQNQYKATIKYAAGTANGLNTIDNLPLKQYFFAAGTDHKFRKCTAVINGNQINITAPSETPLPIQAIRYAFTNYPITNLQNAAGLPSEPFRTDNW